MSTGSALSRDSVRSSVQDTEPQERGLTMVIDHGLPTRHFHDMVASFGGLIDFVKFGWGTCLVTRDIADKAAAARANGVDFFFGGTLFEKYLQQDRVDEWHKLCVDSGTRTVEISNGSVRLSNSEKAEHVARFAAEFTVLSEVGFKDSARAEEVSGQEWLDSIQQDFDAGSSYVITEARESGSSGICTASGELRHDLVNDIAESGLDLGRIIFEAPNRELQTYLLRRLGARTNLGNIRPDDVIGVETLRRGLRADTFNDFEGI